MPGNEDHSQEVIRLAIKAVKLNYKTIGDAIKWFISNANDSEKFKNSHGKISMISLHGQSKSVKFLPNELDLQEVKLISKELQKNGVAFAIDKTGDKTFTIAFSGKNLETVEHSMKKVIQKQDKLLEAKKSSIQDIKDRWKEYMENKANSSEKEKTTIKQKQRQDLEL